MLRLLSGMWGSTWERGKAVETECSFRLSKSTIQGSHYPLDAKVILREDQGTAYSQKLKGNGAQSHKVI